MRHLKLLKHVNLCPKAMLLSPVQPKPKLEFEEIRNKFDWDCEESCGHHSFLQQIENIDYS